ncbi:hypothetical protein ACFFSY_25210 [Paenibacillus aurantiacus]|uniref:Uncharacterized protein n=1 Tax=Paenibacillus aurantiacus TaxID=1936118 RepID=A0ABV5KVI4_9BACL
MVSRSYVPPKSHIPSATHAPQLHSRPSPEARGLSASAIMNLQKTAGNQAVSGMIQRMRDPNRAVVQRYTEIGKNDYRGYTGSWSKESDKLRLADEEDAAVPQSDPTGSQKLYASVELIGEANAALEAVNSPIELKDGNERISSKIDDDKPELHLLVPKFHKDRPNVEASKNNGGGEGANFKLNSDCGFAAHTIADAENLYAVFGGETTDAASDPGLMKAEIVNKLSGQKHEQKFEEYKKNSRLKLKNPKSKKDEKLAELDNFFTDEYKKLQEKDPEFDKINGINSYANPAIGGAYAISSGGEPVSDKDVWNYHWAAVILKSGSDNVTLENYATGDQENNDDWVFQMYGVPTDDENGQSFHEEHRDKHLQHGDTPMTIATTKTKT